MMSPQLHTSFIHMLHILSIYLSIHFRSNVLTRKYESVQEVITDIMVMYENCLLYNDDTAVISKATRKQKSQFKHYCNRVLGIPTL